MGYVCYMLLEASCAVYELGDKILDMNYTVVTCGSLQVN